MLRSRPTPCATSRNEGTPIQATVVRHDAIGRPQPPSRVGGMGSPIQSAGFISNPVGQSMEGRGVAMSSPGMPRHLPQPAVISERTVANASLLNGLILPPMAGTFNPYSPNPVENCGCK